MDKIETKYRQRRREMLVELFSDFEPDLSNSREPDVVLETLHLCKKGYFSKEIAEKVGKTPKAIQKIFRRYDFPRLHNFAMREREEKSSWKGGVKYMKGYKYLSSPGHPNGTKCGNYVAEHRLVVEKKLGRYLLPTEVVDHIDGDISNNHPDNLRVFQSNADHLRETLAGKCPKWSEEGRKRIRGFRKGYDPRRRADCNPPTRD